MNDELDGSFNTYGTDSKCLQNFSWVTLRHSERDKLSPQNIIKIDLKDKMCKDVD